MLTALTLLALIAFAPLGLALLSLIYDAVGLRAVEREIDKIPNLDIAHHNGALESVKDAWRADWKARLADFYAPLVMLFVLPFVSRSATHLPNIFSAWDNNISINGDSGGVLLPDGSWLDWRDVADWEAVKDLPQYSYDDLNYLGDAYYAKGHEPTGFWARYAWLGWRNRASALSLKNGRVVTEPIEVISGSVDIGTKQAGHFLLKSGDTYHYKSATPFTLLGFPLVRIRSYGFKLEIAYKMPNTWQAERVACVAIGWSAKRWKGPKE